MKLFGAQRFGVALLLVATLGLGTPAVVSAAPPDDISASKNEQCNEGETKRCGPVLTSTSRQLAKSRSESGGAGPSPSLVVDGGSWLVEWSQGYYYTSSQIKYWYAYSKRLSGTGSHKLEVHGALVEDIFGSADTRYSFDSAYSVNEFVQSGTTDNWHNLNNHTWLVASGHSYDHGNDGYIDASCSGCIDQYH